MPRKEQISREMDAAVYGPGSEGNEMQPPQDKENPCGPSQMNSSPAEVPKEVHTSCPGQLIRSSIFPIVNFPRLNIVPIHLIPHTQIYIHTYIPIYLYTHVFGFHGYTCIYILGSKTPSIFNAHACMYIYICMHIYIYIYVCMYACICVYVWCWWIWSRVLQPLQSWIMSWWLQPVPSVRSAVEQLFQCMFSFLDGKLVFYFLGYTIDIWYHWYHWWYLHDAYCLEWYYHSWSQGYSISCQFYLRPARSREATAWERCVGGTAADFWVGLGFVAIITIPSGND